MAADDDDFAKDLTEMAQGGFPGAGPDGDDDDEIFGSDGDFFDDLDEEDDDVPPPPGNGGDDFADGFDEDEDGDFEDEDEEEDDVPPSGALDEFFSDEDEDEDDGHIEEDDDDEDDEGPVAKEGSKKGKMIFFGAVSAMALLVGGAGYFVVLPMLTGGGSAPQQSAPPAYTQQANPGYTPPTSNAPLAIPGEERLAGNQAPSFPAMPGSETQAPSPSIGLPVRGEEPLDLGGSPSDSQSSGNRPGLELPDFGNAGELEASPAALEDTPLPEATQSSKSNEQIANVLTKLDDVLNRLDKFEDDVMTKEETRSLVDEVVSKRLMDLPAPSSEASAPAKELSALQASLDELSERLKGIEQANGEKVANLEKRVAELSAQKTAAPANTPSLQLPVVADTPLTVGTGINPAPSEADSEKAPTKPGVKTASVKNSESEAARLRRELAAKKRELDALKARGNGVQPPNRPHIFTEYRLAGLSNDLVWIDTPTGVSMFGVGQEIPGAGRIREFMRMNGNFAVVTESGVIIP
ncbi:hypothetical protein [Salipiger sp. PrR003]|uniref:hypothetical protein n=1 Tax=Salipiger sp. PrR003 TaxID=2706776 RepID=UPI0013DD19C9|nr:hypothetical protein [Salipiger sp. PrR003]NDV52906.1 hypothetical protein [Salipiger sp. PrR003]